MSTRIYLVVNKITKTRRLVEASSQAQSERHVATDLISSTIPSQSELIDAIRAGVSIEKAGEKANVVPLVSGAQQQLQSA